MTRQQIVIPWRDAGEPWRKKHFDFLYEYYSREFEIVIGDNDGEFNRAAARNAGVKKSVSEISVIIDADNFIPLRQIWSAIWVATYDDILVKPFSTFGYLTEQSTNSFYEFFEMIDIDPEYIDPPQVDDFTGGAYVMRRDTWLGIGGMDEGFVGWGAEDDAFHLMCNKIGINTSYVHGYDYHLYHPAYRVTSEYNYEKLMREYVNGD
jgi:glycosyltransferase involved in cell wall biosynthesis